MSQFKINNQRYMKEIKIIKPSDKIIGAVRVPTDLFEKIKKIAVSQGVTNQDIVRAILVNCIDEVTFK